MRILAISLSPSYELLVITTVSMFAVVFMVWFLVELMLDARRTHGRPAQVLPPTEKSHVSHVPR